MDYEKYYRVGNDGTYTIHFPNKKALTLDDIREIFSSYGKVLSINISGDINGLRFVRYKTLDETIACLQGLQNSNDIRILPQKDKLNNSNKKSDHKNFNSWQKLKADNSFSNDKQFNANSAYNGEKLTHNKRSHNDNDNKSDQTDLSDTPSLNFKYNHKFYANRQDKLNSFVTNGKCSPSLKQQNSFDNNVSANNEVSKQQENKFYPQTKSRADFNVNNDISDNRIQQNLTTRCNKKIPELVSDPEIKRKEIDIKSGWLSPTNTKSIPTKPMIIPMQEVIVANIHEKYGVHYILHLFEKCDPISATLVKTISETDIRYCRVYFKTVQDALAVEEEFDNFVLSGKGLIVLRNSQLIDSAKC